MRYLPVLLILVIAVTPAKSQNAGIRLNVGLAVPQTDVVKEYWNPGFATSAGIDIPLSSVMSLRLSGDYSRFSLDDDIVLITNIGIVTNVSGGTLSSLSAMGHAIFKLANDSEFTPYVGLGAGVHRIKIGDLKASELFSSVELIGSESEINFGMMASAGLEYRVSGNATPFVEVTYSKAFIEGDDVGLAALRIGVIFGGGE